MVPYKGTGPQLNAIVAGEVDATVDPFVSMPFIKSGKVRPLAVLLPRRSPLLPDVPTLESRIKGITLDSWAAVLAPAGTPADIVQRLSGEIARIVARPDVRERLAALNYDPVGSTPARNWPRPSSPDTAKWRRVVKKSNYKPED